MKINIVSTGSGGNAILLCDSVLIDVGIPYKYLSRFASQIKVVLLTHIHGDHFNQSSIRKLCLDNPEIKFCCGEFLVGALLEMGLHPDRIITLERGKKYKSGDVVFSPVSLPHDVPNFGYRIIENGHKHFHATDVSNLDGISAPDYASATIECNHDLDAATSIIDQKRLDGEFCHLTRAIATHLNVDKTIEFMIKNRIKKLYPVHIGGLTKMEVMDKLALCKFEVVTA